MESVRNEYFITGVREGYRARSAYKLIQIQESLNLFEDVETAIDLCAAPGSWSQVLSNYLHGLNNKILPNEVRFKDNIKIAAVDLAPLVPIPGVTSIVADITKPETFVRLNQLFDYEKVDLIVCDGAHDVSGLIVGDFDLHLNLITACVHTIIQLLKNKGRFVVKLFDTWGCLLFKNQLRKFFSKVYFVKPHSSRLESYEFFAVCLEFKNLPDFEPFQLTPFLDYRYRDFSQLSGIHKVFIPYLVLGYFRCTDDDVDEIYNKYGEDICRIDNQLEEYFAKTPFTEINEYVFEQSSSDTINKMFNERVCWLMKQEELKFGISQKPLILYLKKSGFIDVKRSFTWNFKTENWMRQNLMPIEQQNSNECEFVNKLFEPYLLDITIPASKIETDLPFPEFQIGDNEEEFSSNNQFCCTNHTAKAIKRVHEICKSNYRTIPTDVDLSQEFDLITALDDQVVRLVETRRKLVGDIIDIFTKF